jgi:outer membrane protein assembly factor BamB
VNQLGLRPFRRRGAFVLAAAVILVGVIAAAAVILTGRTGNVSHPDVSFHPAPVRHRAQRVFSWPIYGFTRDRTRDFDAADHLRPPFRTAWARHGHTLLEYPPVLRGRTLFELNNSADLTAIDTRTGRARWKRDLGALAASSPALHDRRVYVTLLRGHRHTGRVVALSQRRGRVLWSRRLPSRSESSPFVRHHIVYFGTESGTVYALNARNGRTRWTYHAAGAVKGGLACAGGRVYFGDYAGRVYALRARDGHRVWAVGTHGAGFGFTSGQFYSTPAVAFGRVYLGNTDHHVYSFSAATGKLAWARETGGYVYSSPAVADVTHLGPTVYIGSYDGNLYALNARSGDVRWRYHARGPISGAPTIVDGIVYFSTLHAHTTLGLSLRRGHRRYRRHVGAYNPVIAGRHAIYLVGAESLYKLVPERGGLVHSIIAALQRPRRRGRASGHRRHTVRSGGSRHTARHRRRHAAHRRGARRSRHHRRRSRAPRRTRRRRR